jgi:hypothetical protein
LIKTSEVRKMTTVPCPRMSWTRCWKKLFLMKIMN